jgi:hypothetical protein
VKHAFYGQHLVHGCAVTACTPAGSQHQTLSRALVDRRHNQAKTASRRSKSGDP